MAGALPRLDFSRGEDPLWLQWLVRLRWVAIIAQLVTLSLAFGVLHTPLLIIPLLLVSVALTIANFHAQRELARDEEIDQETLLAHLFLDVVALTTYLVLSGGPSNTFTQLYFIHIAMAAVMLRPRYSTALTVLVVVCYAVLHVVHVPLHLEQHSLPSPLLVQLGQLVAFFITSISVAVFVVGVATGLRRQKTFLLEAQESTARTDRLRSVGTLAAGAAHELNTPLSTLGLRLRRIGRRHKDDDTTKDLGVMRDQLDRCSRIVEQLLVGAGDPSASHLERRAAGVFVNEAVRLWSKGATIDVKVLDHSEGAELELPRVAFQQALINLLENAREAQEEAEVFDDLEIELRVDDGQVCIIVRDHGIGLPGDPDRIGDPFFTTKDAGTGLGVFVARAVADGAGGGLRYRSNDGATEAEWWFPLPTRSP